MSEPRPKAELVGCSRIAQMTGFTPRWVQKAAAAGKIPGAKQFAGHWRFDEAKVQRWISESGPKLWQPSTNEEKSGGAVSNIKATRSANRLKLLLGIAP